MRLVRDDRGLQQQPEREGGEQPQWQRGGADVRPKIRVGEAARKQSQCAGQQHQTQGDRARQRPDEEQREAEAEGNAVDHLASRHDVVRRPHDLFGADIADAFARADAAGVGRAENVGAGRAGQRVLYDARARADRAGLLHVAGAGHRYQRYLERVGDIGQP